MADDEEAPRGPEWFADKEAAAPGPFNEDGVPHGKGFMKYPPPPVGEDEDEKPGDTYEGEMRSGRLHGQGLYTWSNGTVYEGNYANSCKEGKGKLTMPDKSVYEGDFVSNKMEGTGLYTFANGDLYQGEFQNGKRSGTGTYHYASVGCQLVGEWSEGLFTSGRWILKDGSIFTGNFDKALTPLEGSHYFSQTHLLQKGVYKKGKWQGTEPASIQV